MLHMCYTNTSTCVSACAFCHAKGSALCLFGLWRFRPSEISFANARGDPFVTRCAQLQVSNSIVFPKLKSGFLFEFNVVRKSESKGFEFKTCCKSSKIRKVVSPGQ